MGFITKDGRRIFIPDAGAAQRVGGGGTVQQPGVLKKLKPGGFDTELTGGGGVVVHASIEQLHEKLLKKGYKKIGEHSEGTVWQNPQSGKEAFGHITSKVDENTSMMKSLIPSVFATVGAQVSHPDHLSQSGAKHTSVNPGLRYIAKGPGAGGPPKQIPQQKFIKTPKYGGDERQGNS